jgi:hypothetical protein
MFRPIFPLRAIALVSALSSWVLIGYAAPAHAVEPLPDARILAAQPFQFKADKEIFSRLPNPPSDSRIFTPRSSKPRSESQMSQTPFEKPMLL